MGIPDRSLRLNVSAKYLAAFLALCFLMFETHEFVHILTGRIICGGWGFRDFNVWGLRSGCSRETPFALVATFAGPLYSYMLIWTGAYLVMAGAAALKSVGFSLIFANLPLARIVTAATGGGDEVYGLRRWLGEPDRSTDQWIWLAGVMATIALIGPPLTVAYRAIDNRNRAKIFAGFLVLPMLAGFATILGILNPLMSLGLLKDIGLFGSPVLVNVWTAAVILFFAVTCRTLTTVASTA